MSKKIDPDYVKFLEDKIRSMEKKRDEIVRHKNIYMKALNRLEDFIQDSDLLEQFKTWKSIIKRLKK